MQSVPGPRTRKNLVDHALLLTGEMVGRARTRRTQRMGARERIVEGSSAVLFLIAAGIVAAGLPNDRSTSPLLIACLAGAYVLVSRSRFEYGNHYVIPEQLVFIPMLLLAPLPYVPAMCAGVCLLAVLPDLVSGAWHRERWVGAMADLWFFLPPVLVVAALAPGAPSIDHLPVYGLAFAAQVAADLAWGLIRNLTLDRQPLRELMSEFLGTARVDAILTPIGFAAGFAAQEEPLFLLLCLGPLAWLFGNFSRDRRERHAATIELNRAYRGTVMLLSDVVESDDAYTADHSRSVVELVNSVSDRLRVDQRSRQELEFAAMLHDVGKIAIPKEILNKPARLTGEEFEVIKTHTIEGQQLLDRVGGLLGRVGEIVRSCHERWDGLGYPDGLAGEKIPLPARIVFACDAYNAMTTNRPYRAAMAREEAIAELELNSGTQFDPEVVEVLVRVVRNGEPDPLATEEIRAVIAGGLTRAAVSR